MEGIRRMSAFLVSYARDNAPSVDFPEDMKRGKRGARRSSAMPVLADVVCPLCGKPVQESARAFGCTDWRNGCAFTLWKDCLTRAAGPELNVKIVQLLLKNGSVRGSTGTLALADGYLTFTKSGENAPAARVNIRYQRPNK